MSDKKVRVRHSRWMEPIGMFQVETEEMIDIEKQKAVSSIIFLMKQMGITVCEINDELAKESEPPRDQFNMGAKKNGSDVR